MRMHGHITHMTDRVRRGQMLTSKGGYKQDSLSRSPDLAKLNPKCHRNYF